MKLLWFTFLQEEEKSSVRGARKKHHDRVERWQEWNMRKGGDRGKRAGKGTGRWRHGLGLKVEVGGEWEEGEIERGVRLRGWGE